MQLRCFGHCRGLCATCGANSVSIFGEPNSRWASRVDGVFLLARTEFKTVDYDFERIGVRFS